VPVTGQRAGHVLAFQRSAGEATLLCVVALHCAQALAGTRSAAPPADWWADTALDLPPGANADEPRIATLLAHSPVHVSVNA
jgi:(1->4)-alpha-D-glucan 1-alpha-D-glucosylmutase